MSALKILTAAVFASFAVAAQAGPYGTGCPAGATPGTADCPAYGTGPGPGAGYGPGTGYGPGAGQGRHGAAMLERFKSADTNADGMISREEAQASLPGLAARFDAIDANKDGLITAAEMQNARLAWRSGGMRGEGWKKWDANGDGQLSREEVAGAPRLAQQFDAIDANKDGFLSAEELQAAHGHFGGRRPG